MKLRNKKTGEVIRFYDGIRLNGEDYDSLAELNEEWEDYEPKEPLIKDEKIRKAVRAWAEANNVRRVFVVGFNALMSKYKGIEIDFDSKPFERIFNEWKTIDELCGEEE